MQILNLPSITFILILSFGSCQPQNLDHLANSWCNCMEPISKLNSQIKKRSQTQSTETLPQLFEKFNQQTQISKECYQHYKSKYDPELLNHIQPKLSNAIHKKCPHTYKLLNQSKTQF